jgi:hypothetical protein
VKRGPTLYFGRLADEATRRGGRPAEPKEREEKTIVMPDLFDRSDDGWREVVGRIGRGERIRGRAL